MKPLLLLLIGCVGVSHLFCGYTTALGGDETGDKLIERFFAEAPTKWEEYRVLSKSLQGKLKASTKVTSSAGGVSISSWEDDIKQNKSSAVIIRALSHKEEAVGKKMKVLEKDEILGQNRQYSFGVLKKDAGLLLEAVNLKPETPVTQLPKPLAEIAFEAVSPHFIFWGNPLAETIKKSKKGPFSGKGVVVEKESRKLIRLDVQQKEQGLTGWALFDPENYWCLLEYELITRETESSWKVTFRVKNEIETSNNFPIIKKYTFLTEASGEGKKNMREGVQEFDLRVVHNVSDHEFTLSAFGMPEPVGVVWPTPPSWYLWIAVAAFGALGLGILFRVLNRRFQTTNGVKT